MTRILMLLEAETWSEAADCLDSAVLNASEPEQLSFGLSLRTPPTEEERAAMDLFSPRLSLVSGLTAWSGIDPVWQGESHVLAAHPAMRFSRRWDRSLLRALGWCQKASGFSSLLTGLLPRDVDPVDAVCSVCATAIDRRLDLHFDRGTPLRYARHPVPGAFINPDFCFAPAAFFRAVAGTELPLFLAAGAAKWEIYTLNRPVIHILWENELPRESLKPHLDSEALRRFEIRNRFQVRDRELPARLRAGVMTWDLGFETKVPAMVRMQEALRTLDSRTSPCTPLCVTFWLSVPGERLDEQRMACFRRLSSLQNLPLQCYTDPPNAQALSLNHGNVTEYRHHYGLQVPKEIMRQDLLNYTHLCKPFLLARTRQRELRYSHYIWLDFDYLRYPVYEKSAMDWQTVCRDRIMMALVDGRPEPSMFSVPEDRLEPLCREIDGLIRHDLSLSLPLPQEKDLWVRLMTAHPDWFEVATLPGRRELLALTMTGRGEEYHTE